MLNLLYRERLKLSRRAFTDESDENVDYLKVKIKMIDWAHQISSLK